MQNSELNARQEQRFKAFQHQFRLLQSEIQVRTSPSDSAEARSESLEFDIHPPSSVQQAQAEPVMTNSNPAISPAFQFPLQIEGRLERLTEADDIEHFLTTFERMATAYRWQKSDWVFHLIPLLTGKARGAYVHMDIDDSLDYDKVKSAILSKYDVAQWQTDGIRLFIVIIIKGVLFCSVKNTHDWRETLKKKIQIILY